MPVDWWVALICFVLFLLLAILGRSFVKRLAAYLNKALEEGRYHASLLFQDPEKMQALEATLDAILPPPTTDSPAVMAFYREKRKKLKKKLLKTAPMTEDGTPFRGE